jgi:hypothetical protein
MGRRVYVCVWYANSLGSLDSHNLGFSFGRQRRSSDIFSRQIIEAPLGTPSIRGVRCGGFVSSCDPLLLCLVVDRRMYVCRCWSTAVLVDTPYDANVPCESRYLPTYVPLLILSVKMGSGKSLSTKERERFVCVRERARACGSPSRENRGRHTPPACPPWHTIHTSPQAHCQPSECVSRLNHVW